MRYTIVAGLKRILALACGGAVAAVMALMNFSVFSRLGKEAAALGGEAENSVYYLYSPSSQAETASFLEISELPHVTGESAVYVFADSKAGEESVYAFKDEIVRVYRAQIAFCERVDGVTSFYGYSPLLKDCLYLNGEKINLHIAVRGERVAVGTPIVFGGY